MTKSQLVKRSRPRGSDSFGKPSSAADASKPQHNFTVPKQKSIYVIIIILELNQVSNKPEVIYTNKSDQFE